jgi:hypothetical protein
MRLLSTVTVALCLASCDAVGRLTDRDVSFWGHVSRRTDGLPPVQHPRRR